jgi:hypothetical protein
MERGAIVHIIPDSRPLFHPYLGAGRRHPISGAVTFDNEEGEG